jgi:vitamin B12/bleomycin/antimicrobial peptide transport system ATP-binding/permease protein
VAPTRMTSWRRFVTVARPFFQLEARWRILGLLAVLLSFMLCLNGLNVIGSYMGRNFTTAVEQRKSDQAFVFALLWAGVFAALTVVAVFKAFTEDRLRLWWRQWLTRYLFERYLSGRAYYHMKARPKVDNPDQRITEDVRIFTEQTLAFVLILTTSVITLLSFSGILWSITPWLLLAAVLYTAFGSVTTILLGRRLVKFDVQQFKKEADLRYDLIHVRTHSESVALMGGEREESEGLSRRLGAVVDNMKAIIGLSRNIGFFTTGFDYLIPLIPLLIVAPMYIRGEAEFGLLWQAQVAFGFVMGAFSIIVKEFQRISTFGAVIERLGVFCEELGEVTADSGKSPIETVTDGTRVAFERLTLVTPREGRLLIKDVSVEVPCGQRLLILGRRGSGRTSVLRAAAGLWPAGQGRVVRPPLEEILFLPQQPYLRHGPLRNQLLYAAGKTGLTDQRLLAALQAVGFEEVLERVGGLDVECDLSTTLSTGEQQRLAIARLLLANPPFAFLDEATSALDVESGHRLYEVLARTPISYISAASDPDLRDYHDKVIELGPDGEWTAGPSYPWPALDASATRPTGRTLEHGLIR